MSVFAGKVRFIPPAIQGAQIEDSIGERLHAAGAAGFIGPQRRIQPDIDSLNEIAGDAHVIIFQENQPAPELRLTGEADDLPDQFLAGIIVGMRLSGKNDLYGPIRIVQDLGKPVFVSQKQRCPLIGCKAARKSDGQRFRIKNIFGASISALEASFASTAGAAACGQKRPAVRVCVHAYATAPRRRWIQRGATRFVLPAVPASSDPDSVHTADSFPRKSRIENERRW